MFRDVDAVIFDMDGTLIDSMWLWKSIDIDYLGRFGLECPDDLQDAIEGMSFSQTAHYFKDRFSLTDPVEVIKDDWNKMATEYYMKEVTLKDYVPEFIQELMDRGIKIGMGTSNSKELATMILQRFGILDMFESVRTSCEVESGKPSPDIFLKVAKDLGVDPSRCIVFEDVPNGLLAAKRAGMRAIAVEDDFSLRMKEQKHALADYYIIDYTEALTSLSKGTKIEHE